MAYGKLETTFAFDMSHVEGELQRIIGGTLREARIALHAEAEIEMTEAKRRTPVDSGALKRSGQVEMKDEMGEITAHLTFGDAAVGYAVPVHEDLEAHHPVGEAKFLESTVLESAPFMHERVARRIVLERTKS